MTTLPQTNTVEIDIANSSLDFGDHNSPSSLSSPAGKNLVVTGISPTKVAAGAGPTGTDEPTANLTLTSSFIGSTVADGSTTIASPTAPSSASTNLFSEEEKKDDEDSTTGICPGTETNNKDVANDDDNDSMDGFLPLRKYDSIDTVMMGKAIPSPVEAPKAGASYHSGAQPAVKVQEVPISSGVPNRCGYNTAADSESIESCGRPAKSGVLIMPGAIVFTRIPILDRSRAIGSVIPTMPPLVAL